MRTVGDPDVLSALERRLRQVTPTSQRRWGKMTAHEMCCHLGDAAEWVLRRRQNVPVPPGRFRRLSKWLGLWAPIPWPHGFPTNPRHDPKAQGTRPEVFSADLDRAISSLQDLAESEVDLEPEHAVFGKMTVRDWHRWAYRHTDHHLRQFGV